MVLKGGGSTHCMCTYSRVCFDSGLFGTKECLRLVALLRGMYETWIILCYQMIPTPD